jgi:signal transduction histidine kinase
MMQSPLDDDESRQSAMLRSFALPACAIIIVIVTYGAIHGMLHQTAPAAAVTALALAVSVAGIAWAVLTGTETSARTVTLLVIVGFSGAVQIGLLPTEDGYLIVLFALISIGMQLPPRLSLVAGLVVFVAANLAYLLARVPPVEIIDNDVGAFFFFTVGLFTRSARASQASAHAAQARAEGLLAELRASQAAQAEAAALTERTRLAREIHDILAHSLSGLVLALDTAELLGQRGTADPDARDADTVAKMLTQVSRAQRIAREGLADSRRAISALRGDELPGPALLDRLVRDTSEATGLDAVLAVAGEPRPLSPEVGLAIYRTAQEALINTAKYAGRGGRAELNLTYRTDDIELAIEDARAADTAPPYPGGLTFGGYGLTGMRERAELLGGRLTAGPTERGFQVLLWLPTGPVAHPVPHGAVPHETVPHETVPHETVPHSTAAG